jgi:hypothetical protein
MFGTSINRYYTVGFVQTNWRRKIFGVKLDRFKLTSYEANCCQAITSLVTSIKGMGFCIKNMATYYYHR